MRHVKTITALILAAIVIASPARAQGKLNIVTTTEDLAAIEVGAAERGAAVPQHGKGEPGSIAREVHI